MSAHDLFEDTRALVLSVAMLAQQVKALESAAEPHGQKLGFIAGRSSKDAMATIHALILAREKLERKTIELDARLERGQGAHACHDAEGAGTHQARVVQRLSRRRERQSSAGERDDHSDEPFSSMKRNQSR